MFPDEETVTFTPKEETAVVENEQQQEQVEETKADQVEETAEEQQEEKPAKKVEPLQKRIDELTKKRHEAERRAAELEAKLKTYEQPADKQTQTPDIDALAARKAEEIVAQRDIQSRFRSWESAGNKEFGREEFTEKSNTLASYGAAERPEFMQIVTDPSLIDDGHKVVAALADDPEEAMRILSLPPVAMSAALVKYADKLAKPAKAKPVSKAPDPIKPISGTAKANDDPNDTDSDEDWFKKRNAQLASKRNTGARF